MTMWIVLGSLIGVVVIFLVVTSVLDRKKNKKIKIEKESLKKEVASSGKSVSEEVKKVVKENEETLKSFIPSVGEIKMSDINRKAKENLKTIKNSRNFKLLSHDSTISEDFDKHLKNMIKEKSNNWSKRNKEDINFFENYKAPAKKVVSEIKKKTKKKGSK